jgi:hypothetical protein
MINAMKDAVTSRAALAFVNNQIARYGTVQDLKIDSRRKTVDISCLLHGEPTPINVKIESYAVETVGDKKFIQITGINCSRPWLHNLLTDFAQNRRVELPTWAAAAL